MHYSTGTRYQALRRISAGTTISYSLPLTGYGGGLPRKRWLVGRGQWQGDLLSIH